MSIFRVTLTGTLFGQIVQNVQHFNWPDGGPANGPALVCDEYDSKWLLNLKNPVSSVVQYISIHAEKLQAGGGGPSFTKSINQLGLAPADTNIALNNAYVLKFSTGLAGRHNRGRCYVPGFRAGWLTNGVINSGGQGAWATQITNLNGFFTSPSGTSFMLLHIMPKGAYQAADGKAVTNIALRLTPGSMRRRMVGVGV